MTPSSSPSATRPAAAKQRRIPGTLIRVHPDGFGFLRADAGTRGNATDYYVHVNDFPDRASWIVGQAVWFDFAPGKTEKAAPRAVRITLRNPGGSDGSTK